MTGRNISHYEILEKLGAGGMGEIYKARDPRLNRTVAIKALSAGASGDPDRRRRFVQEAQAASGLNHPNIITIHDILSEPDGDFMVMEYLSGKTLGEVIPAGGLGVARTLQYGTQIADALAAAHAAGIVHRDLKPGNVMVTEAGRVKILDFGLAKIAVPPSLTDATQTIASGPLTVEGSILGTFSYMSPEQAQGKRVDARSDIFAFGALLYEMVTGRKAFEGDSALTTLTAILRDEVRPVSEFAGGVPRELEEVIGRALRKDPAQRWQSMTEVHGVLEALRQRYESGILQATLVLPPPPAPPTRRGRRVRRGAPWIALAGMALGALFILKDHNASRSPKPDGEVRPPAAAGQAKSEAEPEAATPPPAVPPAAVDHGAPAVAEKGRGVLTKAGVPPAVLEAMRNPGSAAPAAPPAPPAPAPAVPAPNRAAEPPATPARTVALINGLPVMIVLAADIPADPQPGTPLKFTVKRDFEVGGATVLAAGATVTGEVVGSRKGILGRTARPAFRLIAADAVDGTRIALRASPGGSGDRAEHVIEAPGRRDKTLLAPAGTEYIAYIDGAQSFTVRK